ncbi:hypothetical protein [Capybara microvirus Cap3_SP_613]|nr:hypothetical protein [Capybara microvirus Cap3_SP_613]
MKKIRLNFDINFYNTVKSQLDIISVADYFTFLYLVPIMCINSIDFFYNDILFFSVAETLDFSKSILEWFK